MARHLCEQCNRPHEVASTGRPPRFCGDACRVRSHREDKFRAARAAEDARRREAEALVASSPDVARWYLTCRDVGIYVSPEQILAAGGALARRS